jgi:hypothetical protein
VEEEEEGGCVEVGGDGAMVLRLAPVVGDLGLLLFDTCDSSIEYSRAA